MGTNRRAYCSSPSGRNSAGYARQHRALVDERDRHRLGAHAVARDAAGRVGGVKRLEEPRK